MLAVVEYEKSLPVLENRDNGSKCRGRIARSNAVHAERAPALTP